MDVNSENDTSSYSTDGPEQFTTNVQEGAIDPSSKKQTPLLKKFLFGGIFGCLGYLFVGIPITGLILNIVWRFVTVDEIVNSLPQFLQPLIPFIWLFFGMTLPSLPFIYLGIKIAEKTTKTSEVPTARKNNNLLIILLIFVVITLLVLTILGLAMGSAFS